MQMAIIEENLKLVNDIGFIIQDINQSGYFEKKLFNHIFRTQKETYCPKDRVVFENIHQAYSCAYEHLIKYRNSGFIDKIKQYRANRWNK